MAPDLVPNTTYWCNWPMLTGLALLAHFRTLGAPLGVPKAPLYEQIMPFCQSFEAQNGPKSGLLAPETSSDCPEWLDLVQKALFGWSPQVKCSSDPIFGILGLSWVQNGLFCSYNIPLGIPRGTTKRVQKWVSDAYPVNMGQLDQYVVFGTKSGAIQDFRTGKKLSYKG